MKIPMHARLVRLEPNRDFRGAGDHGFVLTVDPIHGWGQLVQQLISAAVDLSRQRASATDRLELKAALQDLLLAQESAFEIRRKDPEKDKPPVLKAVLRRVNRSPGTDTPGGGGTNHGDTR